MCGLRLECATSLTLPAALESPALLGRRSRLLLRIEAELQKQTGGSSPENSWARRLQFQRDCGRAQLAVPSWQQGTSTLARPGRVSPGRQDGTAPPDEKPSYMRWSRPLRNSSLALRHCLACYRIPRMCANYSTYPECGLFLSPKPHGRQTCFTCHASLAPGSNPAMARICRFSGTLCRPKRHP
jgi:hypothetical protein